MKEDQQVEQQRRRQDPWTSMTAGWLSSDRAGDPQLQQTAAVLKPGTVGQGFFGHILFSVGCSFHSTEASWWDCMLQLGWHSRGFVAPEAKGSAFFALSTLSSSEESGCDEDTVDDGPDHDAVHGLGGQHIPRGWHEKWWDKRNAAGRMLLTQWQPLLPTCSLRL